MSDGSLICFINWAEVLLIHGNLRCTGPNLVLEEKCIYLFLMVRVILSLGYSFLGV